MSEQTGSTGAEQEPQGYLGRITNAPSSQGALREVARVVLPEAKDLDALPLYVDAPLRKEGSSGSADEVAEQVAAEADADEERADDERESDHDAER